MGDGEVQPISGIHRYGMIIPRRTTVIFCWNMFSQATARAMAMESSKMRDFYSTSVVSKFREDVQDVLFGRRTKVCCS